MYKSSEGVIVRRARGCTCVHVCMCACTRVGRVKTLLTACSCQAHTCWSLGCKLLTLTLPKLKPHLPSLGCELRLGIQLEQPARKRACGLHELQLEGGGHRRAKREDGMRRREVAVSEVGGELHLALGLRRQLIGELEAQRRQVLLADAHQLLELAHLQVSR